MKGLHWNKIQLPVVPGSAEPAAAANVLWANLEEPEVEYDELAALFGRKAAVPMKKREPKEKETAPSKQLTKILDSKRSQAVGILTQSLRAQISDVENAVMQLDTSILDIEALQSLYDIRATKEEIDMISRHLKNNPDEVLDKPEQFLWDLSKIPHFWRTNFLFRFSVGFPRED
jgi:hypothetical protein